MPIVTDMFAIHQTDVRDLMMIVLSCKGHVTEMLTGINLMETIETAMDDELVIPRTMAMIVHHAMLMRN